MKFKTPNEVMDYYEKQNVVSLVNLQQILTYADWGVQPVLIFRSEFDKKLVAYYFQDDTTDAWKRWRNNKPQQ